jgi:hypothetical protein
MRDEFSRLMAIEFAELMNVAWARNAPLVGMLAKVAAAPELNGYKIEVSQPELMESALSVTVTVVDASTGTRENALHIALQTWGMYIVSDTEKSEPALHTAYTVQPTFENWLNAQSAPRGVNFAKPLYDADAVAPGA